jgi:hypothetical protein
MFTRDLALHLVKVLNNCLISTRIVTFPRNYQTLKQRSTAERQNIYCEII